MKSRTTPATTFRMTLDYISRGDGQTNTLLLSENLNTRSYAGGRILRMAGFPVRPRTWRSWSRWPRVEMVDLLPSGITALSAVWELSRPPTPNRGQAALTLGNVAGVCTDRGRQSRPPLRVQDQQQYQLRKCRAGPSALRPFIPGSSTPSSATGTGAPLISRSMMPSMPGCSPPTAVPTARSSTAPTSDLYVWPRVADERASRRPPLPADAALLWELRLSNRNGCGSAAPSKYRSTQPAVLGPHAAERRRSSPGTCAG